MAASLSAATTAASRTTGYESAAAEASTGSSIVDKDDFLKLLVAQIKNQNPLNPADGVEFLTQLAQFSQLEQLINIRTGVEDLISTVEAGQTGTAAARTA